MLARRIKSSTRSTRAMRTHSISLWRRLPYGEQRAAVEHEIDKLVNAGIARPSTLPWASPIVMVKK